MSMLSKFLKLNESWNKFLVSEQKTVKMKGSHVCDDESNIKGAFPGDAKLQEAFISLCKLKGDRYWDNTYSWLTGHCLAGDVDSNHSSCIIQAMHVFDNPDQTISQIKSDIKKTLDRGPRSADPNDEASRQKTFFFSDNIWSFHAGIWVIYKFHAFYICINNCRCGRQF